MKKLIFLLLAVCAVSLPSFTSVNASVKPATAWNVSGPNVASENDAYLTVTSTTLDWINRQLTVVYSYGAATLSGSNTTAFTRGSQAPQVKVMFDLNTGIWSASTGQSGKMTTAEVSAVTLILSGASNAIVNPAESFAIGHNLFGTGATAYPYATGVTP